MSGHLHALATLPHGIEHRFPLNRRLDGPLSRFRLFGKERRVSPVTTDDEILHTTPEYTGRD